MANMAQRITADLIDSILGHALSDTIIPEIQRRYQVEYDTIYRLYKQLKAEIEKEHLDPADKDAFLAQLQADQYGANPLGATFARLQEEIDKVRRDDGSKYRRMTELEQDLQNREAEMNRMRNLSDVLPPESSDPAMQLINRASNPLMQR